MIIWVDGANGVGKSHVAMELAEIFTNKNAEYIESDLYWMNLLKENFIKGLSGFNPYINKFFLEELRSIIEEKHDLQFDYIVLENQVLKFK